MRLYDEQGRHAYTAHFRRDQHSGGVIRNHIWHGLVECWIHEGGCVLDRNKVCCKATMVMTEARCSELDVFNSKKGFLLAFRRAIDSLTTIKTLRRALWESYRKATQPRRRRMIQAPVNLKEADKVLEELGLLLYHKGDKAGWTACDDAGHVLRGQGKVVLEEGS